MKTSIKTLQEIGSLHDLKTYTGSIKKSGKPDLPTTAILDLYMRRNERDRLGKELGRLRKRKIQLQERLDDVEEEMNKLLMKATEKAMEIRGVAVKGKASNPKGQKRTGKMLLEY